MAKKPGKDQIESRVVSEGLDRKKKVAQYAQD